jgi:hypothetical protein
VDVLHEGSEPDGVHTQAVEVALFQLPEHAAEITALVAPQHGAVLRAAQRAIVG